MSDQPNASAGQQRQTEEKKKEGHELPTLHSMPQQASMNPTTSNAPTGALSALPLNESSGSSTMHQHLNSSASVPIIATIGTSTPTTTTTSTTNTLLADPMIMPEARIIKKPVEVVSHATVDALGDYLDSATHVRSFSVIQEQRRKESYKSGQLVNKTMRLSQQERRRQALLEQTKRRHQLVNHARRLALFSSEGGGSSSSDEDSGQEDEDEDGQKDEDSDEDEEEEEEDEEEDEQDDEEDDRLNTTGKRRKKKKQKTARRHRGDEPNTAGSDGDGLLIIRKDSATLIKQKRRLSSGSESESATARKGEMNDMLSPKKPRLQRPSPKPKKRTPKNPFKDQLMIPEPLTEIPDDLDTNYYIIPIPTGHRCFLISSDGRTTARLPSGQLLVSAFESCLPAGSSNYKGNRKTDYCILDCVYSPKSRTFWTLDIMCWRGHPVYECETEFRFWWLRGKLAEIEGLQQKWIKAQTKEFEAEEAKRRQKWEKRQEKNARRMRRKMEQERLQQQQNQGQNQSQGKLEGTASTITKPSVTSVAAGGSSQRQQDKSLVSSSMNDVAMDDEDAESLSDTGMELEELSSSGWITKEYVSREFWPISFTPLPYFNASMDLVRLLAESMYVPPNSSQVVQPSTIASPQQPSTIATVAAKPSLPQATNSSLTSTSTPTTTPHSHLGTMALSGEIAEAAALFPAHDLDQRRRQDQTLKAERAAGLAFYNKKTMYVLGMTPLCGWVAMDQIGDVFFGEEGGVGPVPGTSAVEGREIEMEGALERITLSV
ncbi:hypothetical protein BGW42_000292 [Actinomortierella wolfii]|nr:hypothetical protein BGW42_000292 [Actinomortierella wolfii]